MYYLKIGNHGAGFTNQIFAFITGIINAYKDGKKVVIVDNFLNDIHDMTYSPISSIFNITKINMFLKENYNIVIIDKNNIEFELLSITYGNDTDCIDLTDIYKEQYTQTSKLFVSRDISFNETYGDPCPGVPKNFIITYKINNYDIQEIYNENLTSDITINFDGPYSFSLGWIDSFNDNMFDNILTNITYHDDFISKSEIMIHGINKEKKINIIHLRLENDGIIHWSRQNNVAPAVYLEYLENKYINLIKEFVSKTDETIILSSSLSNGVIDFLNNDNYNYKFINKFFKDREKNAIIDLLISKYCNNVFIGNFNIKNCNGSSFSYYIWKMTNDNINKIYIDLDNIYDGAVLTRKIDV